MKRILLSLLIASATLLSFNSCTKEYIEEARTITLPDYEIRPQDWNGQNTRRANFIIDAPELSNDIVDFGVVNISMSIDGRKTFDKLPAVIEGVSYSYNYTLGEIIIFAEDPIYSDGLVNIDGIRNFKVSLTPGR
ncbi:hypothetical protein ACFSQ3_14455 [Sphingobacterium corticis]|uniref:DUF4843 domain-containing protein n=1 Tax=Sphingobacterium corticis TaxID=1812823 RepID=A0ABW5NM08_9SPHI